MTQSQVKVNPNNNHVLQLRKHEEEIKSRMTRQSIPRRQSRLRYQNFFDDYCYCCSDFGHKAASCVFNFRNIQWRMFSNNQVLQHKVKQSMIQQEHHSIPSPTRRRAHARNINSFESLYNMPECYICHNFGHKAT